MTRIARSNNVPADKTTATPPLHLPASHVGARTHIHTYTHDNVCTGKRSGSGESCRVLHCGSEGNDDNKTHGGASSRRGRQPTMRTGFYRDGTTELEARPDAHIDPTGRGAADRRTHGEERPDHISQDPAEDGIGARTARYSVLL